jgi:hypothetical protein
MRQLTLNQTKLKMKAKPLPSLNVLEDLFYIDPLSPSGIRWKVNNNKCKEDSIAGSIDKRYGYWRVSVNNQSCRTHRIVYFLSTKQDPGSYNIDHIDGNTQNNCISNLRLATIAQNGRNRTRTKSSTSKCKGVTWHAKANKWMAQIGVDCKNVYLGLFESKEQALEAYTKASSELHGSFGRV